MHRLLGDVDIQTAPDVPFRVDRSLDGSVTTLRESMNRLASEQKRVQFTITGCCYRAVFDRITEAFRQSDCEFSIKHYMYTGGDEIINCVSAIQPVLYLPSYTGYCIEENMFNAQRRAGLSVQHDYRALRRRTGAQADVYGRHDRPAAHDFHRAGG